MKLHQNRMIIVARNHADARAFQERTEHFKDCLESPVIVTTAAHRLNILGATGGMHVGTIYITSDAPEGENYPVVEDVIRRARLIHEGVKVVEEPRSVHA